MMENTYDGVFLAKVVNVSSLSLFLQKSSVIAVWHNPIYASDSYIFFTIFTAIPHDCVKQTYQIFRTANFQDVSEGAILSNDVTFLFSLI